jgi:hypothetical protein
MAARRIEMAKSNVTTVQEYLDALPEDRRSVIATVRNVILRNLPEGYQEQMSFGMIGYVVPLERYPDTYNGQPLAYVALAAQKSYYAVYLTCTYQDPEKEAWFRDAYQKAGKKLDMGKSCVRFKKLQDLPLDVIGQAVAGTSSEEFIASYEAARSR